MSKIDRLQLKRQLQKKWREEHQEYIRAYRELYYGKNRKYYRSKYENMPVDLFMDRNKRKFNEGSKLDY